MNFFNPFSSSNKKVSKKTDSNTDKIQYKIGNYNISLPFEHALPTFQKNHRLYDRFLPLLAKHLPERKVVIDVGANVGDTLIAMIQNSDSKYIGIEPSNEFYPYLEKNIGLLNHDHKSKVVLLKNLIGTGDFEGNIVETKYGTASLKISDEDKPQTKTVSLDSLIKGEKDIILIKVDTDGFDYDVLLSGLDICKELKPILFWENEVQNDMQKTGYNKLYDTLNDIGYKHLFIFDNFGNIMIEDASFNTLKDLTQYVYSMNHNKSSRTIYYNDILAVTEENIDIAKKAILEYRELIIK